MSNKNEKLGALPFVLGGLSFIPLIGIVFGIIAIIWGLVTKKTGGRKLAVIGAGGIAFTITIYSSLYYFGFEKRGGLYDELRAKLAKTQVTSLVTAIEFYKANNGNYPPTLGVLEKSLSENSLVSVYDPSDVSVSGSSKYFYYKLLSSGKYHLLGLGIDGKPFTKDDIVPDVKLGKDSKIGIQLAP